MQPDHPNKKPVPDDDTLLRVVERNWQTAIKNIYDDVPHDLWITFSQEAISIREGHIRAGRLDPTFDWQSDFDAAKFRHQHNLAWLDHHRQVRNRIQNYWQSHTETTDKFLKELSLSGLRIILVVHGAVALGALNILAQHAPEPRLLVAAEAALAFSLVGIMLVGLGQLWIVILLGDLNSRLTGRLGSKISWSKLRAFGRYLSRYGKPGLVATKM